MMPVLKYNCGVIEPKKHNTQNNPKRLEKYFLPTLQEEENLLKALYYLHTGKNCEKLRKSDFKKCDFLFLIFTNTNVG